jgi:hypothetical protein
VCAQGDRSETLARDHNRKRATLIQKSRNEAGLPNTFEKMLVDQGQDDRHLEAFLAECVHESLANYQLANSVFLCERLYAACPTEVRPRARVFYKRNRAPKRKNPPSIPPKASLPGTPPFSHPIPPTSSPPPAGHTPGRHPR